MVIPSVSLLSLAKYFLWLGATGFGGPIALAGSMQRDLVERKRWIEREDYLQGLALAQLAPGPLAAQLAIYMGWLKGRWVGATLVAFAFVLPSFIMVLVLSALYLRLGGLPWMLGAFYVSPRPSPSSPGRLEARAHDAPSRRAVDLRTAPQPPPRPPRGHLDRALGGYWRGPRARPSSLLSVSPFICWAHGVRGPAEPSSPPQPGSTSRPLERSFPGSGLAIVPFLHGGVAMVSLADRRRSSTRSRWR